MVYANQHTQSMNWWHNHELSHVHQCFAFIFVPLYVSNKYKFIVILICDSENIIFVKQKTRKQKQKLKTNNNNKKANKQTNKRKEKKYCIYWILSLNVLKIQYLLNLFFPNSFVDALTSNGFLNVVTPGLICSTYQSERSQTFKYWNGEHAESCCSIYLTVLFMIGGQWWIIKT